MNLEQGHDVTEEEHSIWYPGGTTQGYPLPGGTTQSNPHQEEEWFRDVTPEEGKRKEKDVEGGVEPGE
ncbi:hypothetical protein NDU88_002779 [Pleurodeles waltl]|uniref:Uncharacterized protein n=1 Tax=Pleurodeles waltl TaxID=8319 RepID=A0AAV7REZ1_PLEWA|nr:hypothetical protein NDU88_002779 [Pleurodeles waltl]